MKLIILLVLAVGCAQPKLFLNEKDAVALKEFSKTTQIKTSKSFKINQITDNRPNKMAIGMGKTGVSYTDTPLELNMPFKEYFKSFLTTSFAQRGVMVDELGEVDLDFVVNELWVDELIEKYQPERAKCKVNITVYSKVTNSTWSGNYWTEITSPGDLADATERLAPTLASCMNEIIEKLAKDQSFLAIIK